MSRTCCSGALQQSKEHYCSADDQMMQQCVGRTSLASEAAASLNTKRTVLGPELTATEPQPQTARLSKGDIMSKDTTWMDSLSCPSSWQGDMIAGLMSGMTPLIPQPLSDASADADKLDATPTAWHRLTDLIALSFAYETHERQADARDVIKYCYMFVLPQPFCQHDCALMKEYRPAVRHVLDSCWAVLEWGKTRTTPRLLRAFINSITPFKALNGAQQAAVHAIHASIAKLNRDIAAKFAAKSIDLNAREGEWHVLLASRLGFFGFEGSADELRHLRLGHELRPGPHTGLLLAECLAKTKKKKAAAEALQLVEEALRLYPDHPHVLSHAGDVIISARGESKDSIAEAEGLLQRCVEVLGDRSFLRLKLGTLCEKQGGRQAEALRHFEEACRLNPRHASMIRVIYMKDYSGPNCIRLRP